MIAQITCYYGRCRLDIMIIILISGLVSAIILCLLECMNDDVVVVDLFTSVNEEDYQRCDKFLCLCYLLILALGGFKDLYLDRRIYI